MSQRKPYRVVITPREWPTLEWLAAHGYDAGLLDIASGGEDEEGNVVLEMTESQAWEWTTNIEDDFHAFLANSADEGLNEKLTDLYQGIV